MSDLSKAQEPTTTVATSTPVVEVDKTIPEPVVAKPTTPEQPPAAAILPGTNASNEETNAEKSKESDKHDDLARTLLKGFQSKIAGVFPKKTDKSLEAKEELSDVKEDKKEDEKETKDRRSASRKRNSLFGGFGLGKKEDKTPSEENTGAEGNKDVTPEPGHSIEQNAELHANTEATSSVDISAERPVPTKRVSIFDTFKNQFTKKEKSEVSTTIAKEVETLASTAPVIPAVGSNESTHNEASHEATVDKTQEVQSCVDAKVEKLTSKTEKRKSSLPFGLGLGKKEKTITSSDESNEKPLSPFAKLRATVKSKTSPRIVSEKKEEVNSSVEAKAEAVSPPAIVSEPESAVKTSSHAVAASA